MLSKLTHLTTHRAGRVLLVAALFSMLSLVVSHGLPDRLAAQGFANEKSESEQMLKTVSAATGYDPSEDIIAVVRMPEGGTILSAKGRALAARTAAELKPIKGVTGVVNPLAPGVPEAAIRQAISKDGESVIVRAHTAPHSQDSGVAERAIEATESNLNVTLGGSLISQHYVTSTISEDLARSELIAFPLLFLISLFVFRSLIAAALPLLIGAITIPATMMLISGYNEISSLSVFALNLTTGLGLGLAIDYALLTITRFREELTAGAEKAQAIATTINTAGRTIIFSAATVAGSVLVLAIFPLKFLYSMAFAGATVAVLSAVAALTVLPALLYLLGHNIDRFSVARRTADESAARWYRLADWVMGRPVIVALTVTAVIFVMMMPIRNLNFTSVDASVLPAENPAHMVLKIMDHEFPAGTNAALLISASGPKSDGAKVALLREHILDVKNVTGASPPEFVGDDTWSFRITADSGYYSSRTQEVVKSIREIGSISDQKVGGASASFVDQRETILSRVPLALFLILIVTFIVLFLMTGSAVLPIKTFIMNLLTLGATFGILTWIFGEGHLEGLLGYTSQDALEMTQPILLFVLAFALATDYGVFLLGRIKELRDHGANNHDAVAGGLSRTGRVITSAALLFCVAIGAFSLSDIVFIKQLGIGTALAVAIDATLIRALLVPALMSLLGEYNWWAPRRMKRLHERFGLSEGPSSPAGGGSQATAALVVPVKDAWPTESGTASASIT